MTLPDARSTLSPAEEQVLLSVGVSRARAHLVIVATEATMGRVGGGEAGGTG